jgi:hypothetical protein
MPIKTISSPAHSETTATWKWPDRGIDVQYPNGVGAFSARIEYDPGSQYHDGRLNWKKCSQRVVADRQWTQGSASAEAWNNQSYSWRFPGPSKPSGPLPLVTDSMRDEATQKVVSQFDLNTSDGVLLYSGILQAVPLVGGALRFVSIMNKVARKLSRNLRRQPFSTVVKTAISLDFIDRFVVSPTIDDARKFLNAHNYVVNVMNTLQSRNQEPVALSSVVRNVEDGWEQPFTQKDTSLGNCIATGLERFSRSASVKLCTLCKLDYNLSAVDPVKLWAARTGITRPLDSVWDLVPFSFVVDYFTRAGDFISALSDEMSSQDGLRARLGKIYGQWRCESQNNWVTRTFQSSEPYFWTPKSFQPLGLERVSAGERTFTRYPLDQHELNYGLLSFDSDLIHWNLTNRRAGTLAELFIQAKL